ncbi:alpha/beta fold hydrolase [Streptomyces zhihengii]|uniref:alpha/beta fold hydrolase n=1 Tax=Streptomyces zhihengii TaxID=1818004 RepID=UPI0033AD6C5A
MSRPQRIAVVLTHGAFAESAIWNRVIRRLKHRGYDVTAVSNPLRGVADDAAYVRDVVSGLSRPVVLVGHAYGGMVNSEAAAWNPAVRTLVYVAGLAPDPGESAAQLTRAEPGSTLAENLVSSPLACGDRDLRIADHAYHRQFCADLTPDEAGLMAITQRPVTERALSEGLSVSKPGWRSTPSWFVFGSRDVSIPPTVLRSMAERARSCGTREVPGASHAIPASEPDAVVATIVDAARHLQT